MNYNIIDGTDYQSQSLENNNLYDSLKIILYKR
jgi:hypothetical protein